MLVTQNVDGLHRKAGSKNIVELHGNLYRTKCTKCGQIEENYDSPICASLKDKGDFSKKKPKTKQELKIILGAPEPDCPGANIPVSELPCCSSCGSLVRPDIVWFGESLDWDNIQRAEEKSSKSFSKFSVFIETSYYNVSIESN